MQPLEVPWSRSQFVIANLEGGIVEPTSLLSKKRVVFNSKKVIRVLEKLGIDAVSLANNHLFDVHDSARPTLNALNRHGIGAFGAGDSLSEAGQPYFATQESPPVVLLAFGWEPIQCRIASADSPGVNPLTPANVLTSVKHVEESYPEAKTVLFMHWNYELELYPQPMHRQLAYRAIDAGADAVVGTHSHRVQGIEVYRGAPIVYDLGNWLFVQEEYFGGTVTFPEETSVQLAFELDLYSGHMTCHWFYYDGGSNNAVHINSEDLSRSNRISKLTPYEGMSHDNHVVFFKENRLKKELLPMYKNCDHAIRNGIKDYWNNMRSMIIGALSSMDMKSNRRG